jgi:hypothetical protein
VLTLVVFAYEFHLREDGTRGVASKYKKNMVFHLKRQQLFFMMRVPLNFMMMNIPSGKIDF